MIILRNRKFAEVPEPGETIDEKNDKGSSPNQGKPSSQEVTSRDLQLEQMRLQKQILLIQHQKQQMKIKEDMAKRRQLQQKSRMDAEQKKSQQSNQVKIKKMEVDNEKAENVSLYKNKSRAIDPVPMKV